MVRTPLARGSKASKRSSGLSQIRRRHERCSRSISKARLLSGSRSSPSVIKSTIAPCASTRRAHRLLNAASELAMRVPPDQSATLAEQADWSGGTRIASSLAAFNKRWARRVLAQGAIVLLITDGLERDPDKSLAFEMDRLHRSCRRLIWLNPLLRFDAFEPRAKGVRTMLPYVDEFRPIHNLESMTELCRALSAGGARAGNPRRWLDAA